MGVGDEDQGVLDHGRVVLREGEVFCGEGVDDGVDFEDGGGDVVGEEGGGRGAYAEAAGGRDGSVGLGGLGKN